MTAAELLVHRMLWRPVEGPADPGPVMPLLGPRGAGKSTALRAMSKACGRSLVHARLDFAEPHLADPASAVSYAAFSMMHRWTNLPRDPAFHRVGLSLLALNEPLSSDPAEARAQLRALIRAYLRQHGDDEPSDLKPAALAFATAMAGIAAGPLAPLVQPLVTQGIASLLRFAHRPHRGVRRAQRWFDDLLDQAGVVEALVTLSHRRGDPLDQLVPALLTDLEENARQWSMPVNRCECLPRERRNKPHDHSWLLLVDHVNAADGAGLRFLNALVRARRGREPAGDPLLVVAAVGQWSPTWSHTWREPWYTAAERPTRDPVPPLSQASLEHWSRHRRAHPSAAWYPVWLDPPGPGEIVRLDPGSTEPWSGEFAALVRGLSGGLPSAALDIDRRAAGPPVEGVAADRSVLLRDDGGPALWEEALRRYLPDALRDDALLGALPETVAVAVHLLDPDGRAHDLDAALFPNAAWIERSLRENLWISTFAARPSRLWAVAPGAAEHPAALHPWLVACLLTALHQRSVTVNRRGHAMGWAELCTTLSESTDRPGLARRLYYALACDQLERVSDVLFERFSLDDHQDWLGLLDRVTAAPCRWPAVESAEQTLARLAPDDSPGRGALWAVVRMLVTLLWLYHDPRTVQNDRWDARIRAGLLRLANCELARVDNSALVAAAHRYSPGSRSNPNTW